MSDANFSHVNEQNPTMVDVSAKSITNRNAVAKAHVFVPTRVGELLEKNNFNTEKGPVFSTAIIAGTMAVKNTAQLIPFCHPLMLTSIKINININKNDKTNIIILCEVKTSGQTGVEMEALTGVSVAALTIYDMCKALSTDITIGPISLMAKTGGKCDFDRR